MSIKPKTSLSVSNNYTVVDVETTGLDATWCEIIEVAALRVENGEIVEVFNSLVKPSTLPIDPFIEQLTHITSDMLETAPSADSVLPGLFKFMGDSVLVGHNITFDEKFLSAAAGHDLGNTLVDTLRISRHVNKGVSSHKLENVYNNYVNAGMPKIDGQSHRALYDCEVTQALYEAMKPRLVDLYGEDPDAGFKKHRNSEKYASKTKKDDISQTVENIDDSNPFYGMRVCFTGKMSICTRKDARQRLVNLGGIIEKSVTKKLDYLVIGNDGFVSGVKPGDKSTKQKDAESNQLKGLPVQIVSEDFFMEFAKDV